MTDRAKGRPLKSFPEKSLNCQIDPLVGTRSVGVLVQTERERGRAVGWPPAVVWHSKEVSREQ